MCSDNGKSRFRVFDERVKKAVADAHRLRSLKAWQFLGLSGDEESSSVGE